ncbi:UNVERIFIED_CONTAM: hypothetical protein Sradi_1087400 [Sesamum radiatum]|uniref:Uncharacterized protein n=1 Tax=Sesamum radiatum TaxID=300843 RepID=A0AAW2V7W3_SESRA
MGPSLSPAVRFIAATLVIVLLLAHASDAAVTCSDVVKNLRPWVSYLRSRSGKPASSLLLLLRGIRTCIHDQSPGRPADSLPLPRVLSSK